MNKDCRDWELWNDFLSSLNEAALRTNVAAHQGFDVPGYWKEVMLQALAYFHVLKGIKPHSQSAPAAKPTSVTVIKSVRRIHSYFGITMASSKLYQKLLRSSCDRFIEEHGMSAFTPKQKQAFTNPEIGRLVAVPQGFNVHTIRVDSSCRTWRSIILLVHVLGQTGMRLGDALRLNRNCLHFCFKGRTFPTVNAEVASKISSDDFVMLEVGRTKSDPLGTHWSPYPVYLPVDSTENLNAWRLLFQHDVDFQVSVAHQKSTPLFTDANGNRLTRPFLEKILKSWLKLVNIDPSTHSWHSFRSYLAQALKAAGADNERIKAMVRWVSDKSLQIYAKDSRSEYSSWLAKASRATVDSVNLASMPQMDDDQTHAMLHQLLHNNAPLE